MAKCLAMAAAGLMLLMGAAMGQQPTVPAGSGGGALAAAIRASGATPSV